MRDTRGGNLTNQGVVNCAFPHPAFRKVKTSELGNFNPLPIAHNLPTHCCCFGRLLEQTGDAYAQSCHGIHVRNQRHDKPIRTKDVDGTRVNGEDRPCPGLADELSLRMRRKMARRLHSFAWHVPSLGPW